MTSTAGNLTHRWSRRTSRPSRTHTDIALFGVCVGLAASLAGCGSTATPTPAASSAAAATSSSAGSSTSSTSAASAAAVKVASTSLGDVVVDAKGMTLYMFTKDTQGSGKSSCSGQCLVAWPPLFADGTPTADGVTGTLGTIDTADGKKQVTLDGWPLYYYAKDTKAGDTTGQDVGKVWFVLDKAGTPIKPPAGATTTGY